MVRAKIVSNVKTEQKNMVARTEHVKFTNTRHIRKKHILSNLMRHWWKYKRIVKVGK